MLTTEDLSKHLSPEAVKNVTAWLEKPKYAQYRNDLSEIIDEGHWEELENAFFKVIEFGTGGRRGMTGIGSNRINRVTIGESAQALCEYAKSHDPEAPQKGVVIACDTRLSSPELSKYSAQVCAATGFKTYLFEDFRSTPELSFAVRELGAAIGIVISASHNPPADNGFKAYWSDGGQLVAPHDKGVLKVASEISEINEVNYDKAVQDGKIKLIGREMDEKYIAAVVAEAESSDRDVKIVYSPLHGAGQTNVLPTLKKAGFSDMVLVEDQMVPDGNFPTIENGKPNPEEKAANDRAAALLMAEKADIAITNDPDADRIGMVIRRGNEVFYPNGNQIAVLAADWALSQKQKKSRLSAKNYIAKTIVTTDMLTALADYYGVKMYTDMLIGFKYIGELLHQKEGTDEEFVIGGEESYGLLKGDAVRDKDGAAALPLAEYAAYLKKQGQTMYDRLIELYQQHGLYLERLDGAYFLGASGFEKMQAVMKALRESPPAKVGEHEVTAVLDYQTLERRDVQTGEVSPVVCSAKGNVVVLELDNDYRKRITVRPSGTEPRIKFYLQWFEDVTGEGAHTVEDRYEVVQEHLESLAKELEGMLLK